MTEDNNFLFCIARANDYDSETGEVISECFIKICPNVTYAENDKGKPYYKCCIFDKPINFKSRCRLVEVK